MFVYVLALENGKYYVGLSKSPYKRITNHFNNQGSQWTKRYKPLEIIEVIPDCDLYDEDKYTRKYMDKFGVDNVRGGSYTTFSFGKNTYRHLQREKSFCENKCFKCGESGHYARDCDEIHACINDYERSLSFDEDKYTRKYMDKFGVDNVRDGSYTTFSFDENTHKHLQREKSFCENKCFKCGESGHYARDCDEIHACINDYERSLSFDDDDEKVIQPKVINICLKCGEEGHCWNDCRNINQKKLENVMKNKNFMNNALDCVLKQMNYKSLTCPLCLKKFEKNKYLYYHSYYTCKHRREFIDKVNETQVTLN